MTATGVIEVAVPDIGDFADVPVIEILVAPGDTVALEDPLITLESDKATMDIPAPVAGVVRELHVKVGDRVSEGAVVLTLEPGAEDGVARPAVRAGGEATEAVARVEAVGPSAEAVAVDVGAEALVPRDDGRDPSVPSPPYASPSVRRLARERGVDLGRVSGTGRKGRITAEDVERFVDRGVTPAAPALFRRVVGPVERRPLSRIQKIAARHLSESWTTIPHVTQHDEADVTELEAFRRRLNEEHAGDGLKLTMVGFLVAASVAALKAFPQFNASLDGEDIVLKRYYNIGFAADTEHGLVVPVIRDADHKGILEIARELRDLSGKARAGKLAPADIQDATFTISSLGGIGGTAFTPIINAPEVAILGASRAVTRPVWNGTEFAPRLMLPLSLSYDHRVIDGAAAARFTVHVAGVLGDLRRALL